MGVKVASSEEMRNSPLRWVVEGINRSRRNTAQKDRDGEKGQHGAQIVLHFKFCQSRCLQLIRDNDVCWCQKSLKDAQSQGEKARRVLTILDQL